MKKLILLSIACSLISLTASAKVADELVSRIDQYTKLMAATLAVSEETHRAATAWLLTSQQRAACAKELPAAEMPKSCKDVDDLIEQLSFTDSSGIESYKKIGELTAATQKWMDALPKNDLKQYAYYKLSELLQLYDVCLKEVKSILTWEALRRALFCADIESDQITIAQIDCEIKESHHFVSHGLKSALDTMRAELKAKAERMKREVEKDAKDW